MAGPCRECGERECTALRAASAALAMDDVDAAIEAGLLAWNGCRACALQQGLALSRIEALHAARDLRLRALAARDRYRSRTLRLHRRSDERALRRPSPEHGMAPSLPAAAATALARAKAKAAQKKDP